MTSVYGVFQLWTLSYWILILPLDFCDVSVFGDANIVVLVKTIRLQCVVGQLDQGHCVMHVAWCGRIRLVSIGFKLTFNACNCWRWTCIHVEFQYSLAQLSDIKSHVMVVQGWILSGTRLGLLWSMFPWAWSGLDLGKGVGEGSSDYVSSPINLNQTGTGTLDVLC